MNNDRRRAPRASARVFFNKYIDGRAHLAEAVAISATGMLTRRVHEPDALRATYGVEIGPPDGHAGERVWMCASPVWRTRDHEALVFVESSTRDRALLEQLLAQLAPAARVSA